MFKKNQRLTQSEFSQYFKSGKKHHSLHFSIITAKSSGRKVAVVVGKKVAKSAVKRNLIKRRIYAALRLFLTNNTYNQVLIVLVKPTYTYLSKQAANESLLKEVAEVVKNS